MEVGTNPKQNMKKLTILAPALAVCALALSSCSTPETTTTTTTREQAVTTVPSAPATRTTTVRSGGY